jgi:DNA repair exonuclease SbcCD ATPase subunit
MAGVYRLKECPSCGVEHRKRGQYCSQSCANSERVTTDETKKKLAEANREYNQSPEGIANAKRAAERLSLMNKGLESDLVTIEDFAVDIPDIKDLRDYDGLDGYDRADSW